MYFRFCQFVLATNVVLFLCALISFIPHASKRGSDFTMSKDFFVSQYTDAQRRAWQASCVLAIICSFVFCFVWTWLSKSFRGPVHFDDSGNDVIQENVHVPSLHRFIRRVISAVLYFVVLGGSMGIAYAFAVAQREAENNPDESQVLGFSFVVSCAITLTNNILQIIARTLTTFEKRTTWTAVRHHNALKQITLKILNVWMFLLAKFLVQRANRSDSDSQELCYLDLVGRQYFTLIVMDLTVANFIEVGIPIISRSFKSKYTNASDIASKEDFDVAIEYLELIYRQYIVYVAFNSFPMVSLLAIITNGLEFFIDRYRLIHLMKATGSMETHRMTQFLSFFLTLVAIAGLLSFPSGSAFTISARQSDYDGFWRNCPVLAE